MLTEIQSVPEDKVHGGKRPGAGRPRERELSVFGRWVESKGKTKAELVEILGLSESTLGQLINGSISPSLKVAVKIEELTSHEVPCSSWVKSEP